MTPAGRPMARVVVPVFPQACHEAGVRRVETTPSRVGYRIDLMCGGGSLVGKRVGVAGLEQAKTSVIVRVTLSDGRRVEQLLTGARADFVVPAARPAWSVATDYTVLGIEHIAGGRDHLLFVLALVLLTVLHGGRASCEGSLASGRGPVIEPRQRARRIAGAVSAFTAGHSITLSAAFLGYVRFPARPIEVGIALSIAVLAAELARPGHQDSLLRRRPWAGAAGFGLLHGFGFAGALSAAGLPARAIPLALASFNVGIEIGQMLFVALVLTVLWAVGQAVPPKLHRPGLLAVTSGYAIGIVAACWTLSRLAGGI